MGQIHDTQAVKSAGQRFRSRICLRKGCGEVFHPARWNQRYCRQATCLREVRRWQAAKRQRIYRQSGENRKRHAEAEARRRRVKKESADSKKSSKPAKSNSLNTDASKNRERTAQIRLARGHAAERFRKIFVSGQDAMNRLRRTLVRRFDIVTKIVVMRCVAFETVKQVAETT